eukprot:gene31985-39514_t
MRQMSCSIGKEGNIIKSGDPKSFDLLATLKDIQSKSENKGEDKGVATLTETLEATKASPPVSQTLSGEVSPVPSGQVFFALEFLEIVNNIGFVTTRISSTWTCLRSAKTPRTSASMRIRSDC